MGWFSNEEELRKFQNMSVKAVTTPMNINLDMFKGEGFTFPFWLEAQGLSEFLQLRGTWYPDLVKVFYHNLWVENGDIISKVKGVDIHLDNVLWNIVTNLPFVGAYSHLPTSEVNSLLCKKLVYKEWLRFLGVYIVEKIFAHEGLLKEEKILAHTWQTSFCLAKSRKTG